MAKVKMHSAATIRLQIESALAQKIPAALTPRPNAIRMLRPPEPSSATLQNTRPTAFFFRNQRYAVERVYGPWRTSGNWWTQTLWGCKQWNLIARAQDGRILYCCMTYDLMSHEWRIAGLYDRHIR